MRKKVTPRIEPCGTPPLRRDTSVWHLYTYVTCSLLARKDLNISRGTFLISQTSIFLKSVLWIQRIKTIGKVEQETAYFVSFVQNSYNPNPLWGGLSLAKNLTFAKPSRALLEPTLLSHQVVPFCNFYSKFFFHKTDCFQILERGDYKLIAQYNN